MSDLKNWSYSASNRVMAGLAQELDILPNMHYRPAGYNASRVLSLRLAGANPHYLPKIKSLQVQLTMWAGLSDQYKIRIGHDAHAILIEIPKPKQHWKQVTIEQLQSRRYIRRGAVATLGLGLQDEPRRVNFTDPGVAHVFITGQTRSGKTNAERLIAWNLANNTDPGETRLIIFDVAKRGANWADFSRVAHLAHPVVTDLAEADRVLAWSCQEIERRASERYSSPRLFLLVDELKALLEDSKVATGYLSRIASTGGEFGVHLVLSTQYPQISALGSSDLKRNVTTRLCGRVDDAGAAANALGVPDSGAETLGGYGDFLLKDIESLSRLTVARLKPEHVETLPRAEVQPLELPDDDTTNGGPRPVTQPDPLEPEHVALALFEPSGIAKLADTLHIGKTKATRVKQFADKIRQWAIDHGHGRPYCFISNDFIEL